MIVNELKTLIAAALKSLSIDVEASDIELEHPADMSHGDYSCNVAMIVFSSLIASFSPKDYAKKQKLFGGEMTGERSASPYTLAMSIINSIAEHKYIEKIEVAGPGFINFYLNKDFFEQAVGEVVKSGAEYGKVDVYKEQELLIEHSSPNLFKPFHIGHLVNNTYGEALVRIARSAGANVQALSFPSDVSPGIAKAVWGIIDAGLQESFTIEQVGEAYTAGSKAYKEESAAKSRIDEININLYEQDKTAEEWAVYKCGRDLSLSYFKTMTARLGSEFAGFIFESEAEEVGKEIVKQNTPKVFTESEGAVIFKGSEYGLFDNVYINSAGFGTYLAKDTGLLSIKFSKYKFDKSITVTDIEQKQHFELVQKSAELIEPQWANKSQFLQHGRLALTTGKISSRDGGVPLAADVIDTVKEAALSRAKESGKEMNEGVAEQVAIGAIKYAIAKVSMGKNIVFDLEKSLSFEGDSGPYLQYTYARCKSVLAKAYPHREQRQVQVPQDWQVTNIEKLLYRLPEVVERAALEYEPHYIANYLNTLASAYNSWYGQGKILDGTDNEHYKLALTEAVAQSIKNGLNMLGIDAPEQM